MASARHGDGEATVHSTRPMGPSRRQEILRHAKGETETT